MRGDSGPADPTVLNTTVLSNFAYIDRVDLLADLSGVCTVPAVRDELRDGVDSHRFLQSALEVIEAGIQVAPISELVATREAAAVTALDPGEAQAFALAAARNARLVTDDGEARTFARDHGVTVVGSEGVLLAGIDAGRLDEQTADDWLSTWIDETGYYVPSRDISAYL
jgi:predicted nucleic acid-binding protein